MCCFDALAHVQLRCSAWRADGEANERRLEKGGSAEREEHTEPAEEHQRAGERES